MLDYSRQLREQHEIAVIAPILLCGEKVSSPSVVRLGRSKLLKRDFHGTSSDMIIPLNSGTLIRIDALREIGGFNEDFWLDFSDVVVQTLLIEGESVYMLQEISAFRMRRRSIIWSMRCPRCGTAIFLPPRGPFGIFYQSPHLHIFYSTRLALRTLKQYARFQNEDLSQAHFIAVSSTGSLVS